MVIFNFNRHECFWSDTRQLVRRNIFKDMAMIYELVNGLFKTEYTTYSTATAEVEFTEMDS